MFNTVCYYLNFISPRIPASLRYVAWRVLPSTPWRYDAPAAGYEGGVDVRGLGTVAFLDRDGVLTFRW